MLPTPLIILSWFMIGCKTSNLEAVDSWSGSVHYVCLVFKSSQIGSSRWVFLGGFQAKTSRPVQFAIL